MKITEKHRDSSSQQHTYFTKVLITHPDDPIFDGQWKKINEAFNILGFSTTLPPEKRKQLCETPAYQEMMCECQVLVMQAN